LEKERRSRFFKAALLGIFPGIFLAGGTTFHQLQIRRYNNTILQHIFFKFKTTIL